MEVNFTGTADVPVWTDITEFVQAYDTTRGRDEELARDEAGTATVLLRNEDRRFEPEYGGVLVNLLLNPSLEGAVPVGYIPIGGGGTALTGGQTSVPPEIVSAHSMRVDTATWEGSGIGYEYGPTDRVAVTAGLAYSFSLYALGASGATKSMDLTLQWLQADGVTTVSLLNTTVTMAAAASGWQRYSVTATAPANAAQVLPVFQTTTAQGAFTFYTDGWQFEQAAAASAYCDGEQDGCAWAGTPDASVSWRGGTYFPNVELFRRFRILQTWESMTYSLFDGYAENWEVVYDNSGNASEVRLHGADGFTLLSRQFLPADWEAPGELGHTRITRVLDAVSWPISDRDLEDGHSLMAPVVAPDEPTTPINALETLKAVAQAEGGRLFMSGPGAVTFYNRHHAVLPPNDVPQATFDDDGPLLFDSPLTAFDSTKLYNEIRATTQGAEAEHVVQDAASIEKYRATLSLSLDLTPLLDPNELDDAAQYWLDQYKTSRRRFVGLTLRPRRSPSVLWTEAFERELGDRISVELQPPGGGLPITQTTFIQGIAHHGDVWGDYTTTFRLSPIGVDYAPGALWVLDSSGDTTLGVDSVLRY